MPMRPTQAQITDTLHDIGQARQAVESAIADRLSDPETINALLNTIDEILEQASDTLKPFVNNSVFPDPRDE